MASAKEYAYYIRGNQVAILQKDTTSSSGGLNYEYDPTVGIELPTSGGTWKSPLAAVENGLQIEYTHEGAWEYITKFNHGIYDEADDAGVLKFRIKATHGNLTALYTAGHKFLVRNSENFSGLHEAVSSTFSTYTTITTNTKVKGKSVAGIFTDNVYSYYDIDVLDDEDSIIPVNSYQGLALVYYIKARLMEDTGDIKKRDFFMAQFHKMVEQDNSSKIYGARSIAPGPNAIR